MNDLTCPPGDPLVQFMVVYQYDDEDQLRGRLIWARNPAHATELVERQGPALLRRARATDAREFLEAEVTA